MKKSRRFSKKYKSKAPKDLSVKLRDEILKENFRIKSTTGKYPMYLIHYKKRNYFVEYDSVNEKIITILPGRGYDRFGMNI